MNAKIIVTPQDKVTCPHCSKTYALSDALTSRIIDGYAAEYEQMLVQERDALTAQVTRDVERKQSRAHSDQLADLQAQLDRGRTEQDRLKAHLNDARTQALAEAKAESEREAAELKAALQAKDAKLGEYRQAEMNLRREKAAIEDQKRELALELQRQLDAERALIEFKLSQSFSLREAELRKKISDAQKVNEDLTRKLEQGSQQLRGEVLELALEDLLQSCYPLDKVEAVKKGVNGADVVQSVHLRSGTCCGKIVWEAKRAEHWSNAWVTKLKDDQRKAGADIAVLVTTALPAGVKDAVVMYEGVWLVHPSVVRGLSEALRLVLMESQRQRSVSAAKDEQAEAMFDYICSNQFAQRVCAVVDCYEEMRTDLEREKAAVQRLWKKRETQIARITQQVVEVCGELQGISAKELPHLDGVAMLV